MARFPGPQHHIVERRSPIFARVQLATRFQKLVRAPHRATVQQHFHASYLGRPNSRVGHDKVEMSQSGRVDRIPYFKRQVRQRVRLHEPFVLANQLLHHLAMVISDEDRNQRHEQGGDRKYLVQPMMAGPVMLVRSLDFDVHLGPAFRHTRIGIST
jgi:hypothetical protein